MAEFIDKVTAKLKDHVWCAILVAAIVLLSFVIIAFGGGEQKISYASFASAIVSIVLGIIVIVYTLIQHGQSQQNLTEMRNLISEGQQVITERTSTMIGTAEELRESIANLTIPQTIESGEQEGNAVELCEVMEFKIDMGRASHMLLVIFYCLGKSQKEGTGIEVWNIAKQLSERLGLSFPLEIIVGCILSVRSMINCIFKPSSITSAGQYLKDYTIEAKKLPDELADNARNEIENRLSKPDVSIEHKKRMESSILLVDEYFAKVKEDA